MLSTKRLISIILTPNKLGKNLDNTDLNESKASLVGFANEKLYFKYAIKCITKLKNPPKSTPKHRNVVEKFKK